MTSLRQQFGMTMVLLCAAWSSASALDHEPHERIRATAERHALQQTEHLSGRVEVQVGSLDSRLRLNRCDLPLEAYDSPNGLNGGRGVVGVRCEGSKPWRLFVPVSVALIDQVVVNRLPLVKDQSLRAEDLALSETDVSGLHQRYYRDIEDVVGLRSKRSISAGTTLHSGLLQRHRLVERGSQVRIIADIGGLQVSMHGKALADGGHGDRIRVKNLDSGRVVTGTVTGQSRVDVGH